MQKLEGTAMTELVEGDKLKRADILLAHSKGSYWGRPFGSVFYRGKRR
jgi:hypothetical protein